ncbi:serine/threonine protein phosphatase [Aggregicoccus sp. 17bor-14]|uniref:metallophosphoesterase n=1 Tax=Myxococcaceae TaxID=31 RepID=UPI00129CC4A3|nr:MULTISPECIES: metallophosphoesterase [Myxococcaceae]MBF5041475.1 metallophosphoesterase [Simulacricoccus sp. 17bor-14]MRI87259.1 serine/threonine protein phosphatase [Aggregicoccus sp. 17bor-14]
MPRDSLLIAAVGDIHGRFHRVETWLEALEAAHGRPVDAVLAVGDVEAFRRADDHRRKAAKRAMPAEFAEYADGSRRVRRPLYFIGGNNEDFEALHDAPGGFELAPDVHYLGRAGLRELLGLRVAYLSGIHAPRFFEQPLLRPRTLDTSKQAGYFRQAEVERVSGLRDVDLLLVHEWPRGLVPRLREGELPPGGRPLPSSWVGNPITRKVIEAVRPQWVLCGHSHRAFAATVGGGAHPLTRIACLDQAARPDESLLWMEWEGRSPVRAGWGTSASPAWEAPGRWSLESLPVRGQDAAADAESPGMA